MSLAALPRKAHLALAIAVALGFFVFLAIGITGTNFGDASAGDPDDFTALVDAIFDEHVLALEVLGILLTAALIGAMIIARPLGTVADSTNYPNRLPASELPAIQDISDVARNLGSGSFPVTDLDLGGEEE